MSKISKIILSFFILFLFLGCSEEESGGEIGLTAPEISVNTLDGKKVRLKDYKDKIKVLVFWQDGCSGCLVALPHFDSMLDKYGDKMVVLGINSVNKEDKIAQFANESNFKHIIITKDSLDISWSRYSIFALPSIIIIGKDGVVKDRIIGDRPWKIIESKVLSFL